MVWNRIESVPKDGTEVLFYAAPKHFDVGKWEDGSPWLHDSYGEWRLADFMPTWWARLEPPMVFENCQFMQPLDNTSPSRPASPTTF